MGEPVRFQASTSGEVDTATLVRRAQEGDVWALESLYRLHSGRVYAICLRLAGDAEAAEEWAQDAWVRAWERIGTFRGESAFPTWLHRLTTNVALDRMRSDRTRLRRTESAGDEESIRPRAECPPGVKMDLERAVAALPDGARTVFVLYDVEGYKHREIADRLGVAEGTVKAQLHRARKMLREALQ
jgi:RNA polymerase sigma-70 factor, ECF subfamily